MSLSLSLPYIMNGDLYRKAADFVGNNIPPMKLLQDIMGYTQMRNTEKSTQTQIDYNNYLVGGNNRALADWYRNVGSQGRKIRYPEFTYPGEIYRANTASARAMFDASSASANFYGNVPFRSAGLYGIGGKLSRSL